MNTRSLVVLFGIVVQLSLAQPTWAWAQTISVKSLLEGKGPKESELSLPSVRFLDRWLRSNEAERKKLSAKYCVGESTTPVTPHVPAARVLCEVWKRENAERLGIINSESRATLSELKQWLQAPSTENADRLERVCAIEKQDRALQKAIKGEQSRSELMSFMMGWLPLVHSRPCLSIVLGQKAEELLPEEIAFHWVDEFYRRAILDSPVNAHNEFKQDARFDKARFRLTLLWILKNKSCPREVHAWLKPLSERNDGDFVLRSLYWRLHCAKEAKDQALVLKIQEQLLQRYPMSFHRIHASASPEFELRKILERAESPLQARSVSTQEANLWIAVAEYYAQNRHPKAGAWAKKTIDAIEEQQLMQNWILEPEVTAYLGWLKGVSGNPIEQYKNFSQAVREKPEILSRPFLEMYFPLARRQVIEKYSKRQGIDPFLVAALIRQESGFVPRAHSGAGAMGWMQLLPSTAKRFARLRKGQLFEPETNVRVGTRYLQVLLERFQNQIPLALAAYNAGPEVAASWERRYGGAQGVLFWDLIPYRETREYVALIARNYLWYQSLYGKTVLFNTLFTTADQSKEI